MNICRALILCLSALLLRVDPAIAHGYPAEFTPAPDAALRQSPARVWLRFDSFLEPALSKLTVRDSTGREVARGGVDSDPKLLIVRLPKLAPGVYRVIWTVVARDAHRTQGAYSFRVL